MSLIPFFNHHLFDDDDWFIPSHGLFPPHRRFVEPSSRQLDLFRPNFSQTLDSAMQEMEENIDRVCRPSSMDEYRALTNPIVEDNQGNRKLKLAFDLKNFKPEEMKVSVSSDKKTLKVDAKHEKKDETHSVCRMYSRQYTLPEDLDSTKLQSTLKPNGTLFIEAPLPRKAPDGTKAVEQPIQIPIKME